MPTADTLVLNRSFQRMITHEARYAASAAWLSTVDDAVHPFLRVLDHQAVAAAMEAIEQHHPAVVAHLATMGTWLRATPVDPPAAGSHGPLAREQARAAADFKRLTLAAGAACVAYEQARDRLSAELARIHHLRLTAQQRFLTTLRRYHPQVSALRPPDYQPRIIEAPAPHADAVATRNALVRLHELSPTAGR